LVLLLAPLYSTRAHEKPGKPKVRAITAFVRLDRSRYEAETRETLEMLRLARATFNKAGYEVESIRITTQPFPEYIQGLSNQKALAFFQAYDALALKESFDANIGAAMIEARDDPAPADLLAQVLTSTKTIESSIVVAGEDGIRWKSVRAAATLLKYVEEHSLHSQGNFNFAATAMLKPYAPFYPGSYHTGSGRRFAIGLESANVVEEVFTETGNQPEIARERLAKALGEHAQAVEAIALSIERETHWTYLGLDTTPVPMPGVSIARAIERLTGVPFGSSGTLTATASITAALRQIPVRQIGYPGLMLPVLEDNVLAQRWSEGTYDMDSLLAYSAVCGTGLDTVPLPGEVSEQQLERIIGDVASLAFKWRKPLAARLLPVYGKKVGERTEFDDPFLVNTTLRPLP
jgi:uncharacterized protein (UPF0210 family)